MKIIDVKTFIVGTPPPHKGGINWVFLKLITDEGVEGVGECSAPFMREQTLVQLIKELGEYYIVGSNPFDIERLWDALYAGMGMHYFRHPGIISTQAIAGFEIACWDIIGKVLNQPVYNLLGGRCHDRLRAYTYVYDYMFKPTATPEEVGEAVARLVEDGFTAVKFDPIYPLCPAPRELSLEDLYRAESIVKKVRKTVGNKCDILIGTHGQLTTHSAIRFAKMLEPYDPLWLEEPIPAENVDEMARVAQHTSIPIATGERLCTKYEFRELLQKQAAQIVQINNGLNGMLEAKKIAGMCEAHYAQIAPWIYCGPVGAAAAIQLSVCSPNFLIQESIETWDGFHTDILKEPTLKWEQGYIIPSTKAGLGVELDEEVLAKHPYSKDAYSPRIASYFDFVKGR